MQIRPKVYLHLIWLWRSLRNLTLPHHGDPRAEASPFLTFVAIVLAFLLVALEVDAHKGELEARGLAGNNCIISGVFLSP